MRTNYYMIRKCPPCTKKCTKTENIILTHTGSLKLTKKSSSNSRRTCTSAPCSQTLWCVCLCLRAGRCSPSHELLAPSTYCYHTHGKQQILQNNYLTKSHDSSIVRTIWSHFWTLYTPNTFTVPWTEISYDTLLTKIIRCLMVGWLFFSSHICFSFRSL